VLGGNHICTQKKEESKIINNKPVAVPPPEWWAEALIPLDDVLPSACCDVGFTGIQD
jgi:hypothetical protein